MKPGNKENDLIRPFKDNILVALSWVYVILCTFVLVYVEETKGMVSPRSKETIRYTKYKAWDYIKVLASILFYEKNQRGHRNLENRK